MAGSTEQTGKQATRRDRRTAAVVALVWLAGTYAAGGWMAVLGTLVAWSLALLVWGLAIMHGEGRL